MKTPVFIFDGDRSEYTISFYKKEKFNKPNAIIQVTKNSYQRLQTKIPCAQAYFMIRSRGIAKNFLPIQSDYEVALMKKKILTYILVSRALNPKNKNKKCPKVTTKSNLCNQWYEIL